MSHNRTAYNELFFLGNAFVILKGKSDSLAFTIPSILNA